MKRGFSNVPSTKFNRVFMLASSDGWAFTREDN